MAKRFPSNDFKYIPIDSVFCADFKYEICLKTNVDYSVQNPSNISQNCQKSAIENKLLRVWLSGSQWTEKGGQEQFSDAESILSQRYVHYVGPSEI